MIIEYNNNQTDANAKRKIQQKIANIDEKVQALGRIFLSPFHLPHPSFPFSRINNILLLW